MPDPIELGSTAYSLHPDQRRPGARRGRSTPDHPFTRRDDPEFTPPGEPPPDGALRRFLGWIASAASGRNDAPG